MSFCSPPESQTTGSNTVMLKIQCPCGHVGLVAAETLPRELRCWQCGSSRGVEVKDGRRIVNRVAIIEWLCGAVGAGAVEGESRQHQK
jgi:hypothetical protein